MANLHKGIRAIHDNVVTINEEDDDADHVGQGGKPAEERDKRAELQAEDGDSQSTRGSAFAVGGGGVPEERVRRCRTDPADEPDDGRGQQHGDVEQDPEDHPRHRPDAAGHAQAADAVAVALQRGDLFFFAAIRSGPVPERVGAQCDAKNSQRDAHC